MSLHRWRVEHWGEPHELVLSVHASVTERKRALERHRAVEVFDRCFVGWDRDDRRHDLAGLCSELDLLGGGDWLRVSTPALLEAIRREVASGRLLVIGQRVTPVQVVARSASPSPLRPAPAPPAPPPKPVVMAAPAKKVWLELELADGTGQPYVARFEIEGSDGNQQAGTLDAKGHTRVDGLPPGPAHVTFPDLDEDAWTSA